MSERDADHNPLVVRIVVHSFDEVEISVPVFEVEVSQEPSGLWCETFATLDLLNAFLRGVQCGLSFPRGSFAFVPILREMPSSWSLHRAPYQLWPETVPGEDETKKLQPKKVNWCYGCKRTLPDDVKIEHDDFEEIPWHRAGHNMRSDHVRINGIEVNVCGPVFRQRSSEAMKRFLEEDR